MGRSVPDLVTVLAAGLVERALGTTATDSVDQALETTATAWVGQVPELMTAEAAWATATALDQAVQAVQAAWEVASAEMDSAATALAVLGTALAAPSSRPSPSSPFREEGSALGRLRVQETRIWPMQRSRLPPRRTSRSPQLLMDEAHHLTWPLLSRPRQCSECTLHCRPFSESDHHNPLPTDNSFSLATPTSPSMTLRPLAVSCQLLSLTPQQGLWRGGWDGLVVLFFESYGKETRECQSNEEASRLRSCIQLMGVRSAQT